MLLWLQMAAFDSHRRALHLFPSSRGPAEACCRTHKVERTTLKSATSPLKRVGCRVSIHHGQLWETQTLTIALNHTLAA